MLARWLPEHRECGSAIVETADAAPQKAVAAGATASDNFLTDFVAGRTNHNKRT